MSQPNAGSTGGSGSPFDMIRPQHIASIPVLNDDDKRRYAEGLDKLWTTVKTHPQDSEPYQKAVAKIREVSKDIMQRMARYKAAKAQAAQQANQQQQQPQQSGQVAAQQTGGQMQQQQQQMQQRQQQQLQQQQQQQQQSQQQQQQAQQPAQSTPQAQPQQRQQSQPGQQPVKLSAQAEEFLRKFEIFPPQGIMANTPEFAQFKARTLTTLQKCLMASDKYGANLKEISLREQQLSSAGQSLPPEQVQQRENIKNVIQRAKAEFDRVKKENEANKQSFLAQRAQNAQNPQNPQQAGAAQVPQAAATQTQPQPQAQAPATQPQQARQQIPTAPQVQQVADGQQQVPQMPQQQQNAQFPAQSTPQPSLPQQQQAQQAQTQQQQARPQPVPQQQQPQNQAQYGQQMQQPGPPQALSHQAAMAAINRTYSDAPASQQSAPIQRPAPGSATGPNTPTQSGTPFPHQPTSSTISSTKMPIPPKLSTPVAQPVQMAPARPTIGAGPQGMLGQPGLQKAPGFTLEGDDGRVLSKKKLDDLVRQVTGGGEGLTPEVEEAVLGLADDFVDSVLTSACRLAKIRPNSSLDIRDIQLILERNYNIRIPGYSLDEVRTVRKFQPASGWTQKMNAVQAAKVMGRGDN